MTRHVFVFFAFFSLTACRGGSDDPAPYNGVWCSDGRCDAQETASSCPADCPASCGDAVCSDDESQYSCPADCGTPDPSCGNCDDGNDCTSDSCVSGQCVNNPLPDQVMGCSDSTTLSRCDNGRERDVGCGGACEYGGYNTYLSCDPDALTCWCNDLSTTGSCDAANVGRESCVNWTSGESDIAVCKSPSQAGADDYMWRVYSCDEICRDAGYDYATGCFTDSQDSSNRKCSCGVSCPPCGSGERCNASTGQCEDEAECSSNSDCPSQTICEYGECVAVECTNDAHCYGCNRCINNYCSYCGEGPYGCYC